MNPYTILFGILAVLIVLWALKIAKRLVSLLLSIAILVIIGYFISQILF